MAEGFQPLEMQSHWQPASHEEADLPTSGTTWPRSGPFLARLQANGRLSESVLARLKAACAQPRLVPARTDLVSIGQRASDLHILFDGWAARHKVHSGGRRQISALLLAGDICDLDQLYLPRPDQTVTTLTECLIVSVARADLLQLMQEYPALNLAMGSLAATENTILGERICGLGQRKGVQDLAHLVCQLLFRLFFVGQASEQQFRLPLTQEQLGEVLGLTGVHVNRMLQQLRAQDLMERRGDRITIPDLDALVSFAGFSPTYCHFGETVASERAGSPRLSEADASIVAASRPGLDDPEPASGLIITQEALPPFDDRDELRHRFKNMVAIAQALVSQTLKEGVPIAQARRLLNERLAAMAGAVDLLASGNWQDGSLKDTISTALRLSGAANGRIHCAGPELRLGRKAVMSLTLALHELQTNAIKYGALATPEGSVQLFWKIIPDAAGDRFWMQWAERDGPAVVEPQKSGFGTRLITDVTAGAFEGEVALDYGPAGLTWILSAPAECIAR